MRCFWMKRETISKASRPHGLSNERDLDMAICMNKQYKTILMEIWGLTAEYPATCLDLIE